MKILYALIFFVVLLLPLPISAQAPAEVDKKIEELRRKIDELQSQENSLKKNISLLNSQIDLTALKINTIQQAITKLAGEIDALVDEIDRLEVQLTKRSELVLHRIPESYKRQAASQFGLLLLSKNFSDFLARVKYMSSVQATDAQLLLQLKLTQNNYGERKERREQKKKEQENLRKQLEIENLELARQKKEKQALLEQTRNDEATYQKLLAQALAEKQALERALVEGVKIGPIKRGDPIALVGNSGYPGCSTGPHLHFEIRKNGAWVDPSGFLSSKTVDDEQNGGSRTVGGGGWDWPLADTIRMTQYFGKTPYSWRYAYSGGIHTGFDMVSTSSNIIRAPSDGTLFSSSQNCGSSSIIKIKYIEYSDGIITFYLHVQ